MILKFIRVCLGNNHRPYSDYQSGNCLWTVYIVSDSISNEVVNFRLLTVFKHFDVEILSLS